MVGDPVDSLLMSLIEKEIPDGRSALIESHHNLADLSAYCKESYINSADKAKSLHETKEYASQSLASVAYQIHSLAVNILQMMDQQTIQLQKMQSNANNIGLLVDIHKEKVARREIGVLTSSKNFSRAHKVVPPAKPEKLRKYQREEIDYSALDNIGHGVRTECREDTTQQHRQQRFSTSSSSGSLKEMNSNSSSVHSSSQGSIHANNVAGLYKTNSSDRKAAFSVSTMPPPPRPPIAPVAPFKVKAGSTSGGMVTGPIVAMPPMPGTNAAEAMPPPPSPMNIPEPEYDGKSSYADNQPSRHPSASDKNSLDISQPLHIVPIVPPLPPKAQHVSIAIVNSPVASSSSRSSSRSSTRSSHLAVNSLPTFSPVETTSPPFSGNNKSHFPELNDSTNAAGADANTGDQNTPVSEDPPSPIPVYDYPRYNTTTSGASHYDIPRHGSTTNVAGAGAYSIPPAPPPPPQFRTSLVIPTTHAPPPPIAPPPPPIPGGNDAHKPRPPKMSPLDGCAMPAPPPAPPPPNFASGVPQFVPPAPVVAAAPLPPLPPPPAPPPPPPQAPAPPAPPAPPPAPTAMINFTIPTTPMYGRSSSLPPCKSPRISAPTRSPASTPSSPMTPAAPGREEPEYAVPFATASSHMRRSMHCDAGPLQSGSSLSNGFGNYNGHCALNGDGVDDMDSRNLPLPPPPPLTDELYQVPTNNLPLSPLDDLPPPPPDTMYPGEPYHGGGDPYNGGDNVYEVVPPPPPPPMMLMSGEGGTIVPESYEEKVVAIYDYEKLREDELELHEGDIIYVIKKNEDGWFEGIKDGVQGLFPGNYVTASAEFYQ